MQYIIPFFAILYLFSRYIFRVDFWHSLTVSKHIKEEQHRFFINNFDYYKALPDKEQRLFVRRVNYFKSIKKIVGRQGFNVTEEVKLIISACAVQLSFGLSNYYLAKFKTIFVYPDVFENKLTGNMHKGEVNAKGLIALSWKHFLKGYSIPDDKINLGLHEMAHALMLTIIRTNFHDTSLDNYLLRVIKCSQNEIQIIRSDEHHFFRSYAGTNMHEFFAVAVEHFFESPAEFRDKLPKLYEYMCIVLNQNPASGLYRGLVKNKKAVA